MKRRKKLWMMGALLAVVLVLTLSVILMEHTQEKIRSSGELILEIPTQEVTALSWDYDGKTLAFEKDDNWHYAEDPDFPVSTRKLENMLDPFERFSAAFVIEEPEDLAQYGLEAPACTIGITAGDRDYTVKVGAMSKMDEQRYVDIGDGNVYLVYHDPMQEFDTELRAVIENDKPPYLDQADRITIRGEETYEILRSPEDGHSHRPEDQYYARVDGKLLPLNTDSVSSWLSQLTLVSLTDYKTYTADGEALEQYGLNQPDLTVTVDYTTEQEDGPQEQKQFTLALSQDREALAAAEKAEQEGTEPAPVPAYARVGDSRILYEIRPQDYLDVSACRYDDLRHYEIFPAKFDDVRAMVVKLDGRTYSLTTEQLEDDSTAFFYEGRQVEMGDVASSLRALYAEEFLQEAPRDKLELGMAFTLEDGATVEVELYRRDGKTCLAAVDGEPVAAIPRTQVVDLIEDLNAIVLEKVEDTQEG